MELADEEAWEMKTHGSTTPTPEFQFPFPSTTKASMYNSHQKENQ